MTPTKTLVISGLAVALVYIAAMFINIRVPVPGSGGMIHLGDLPLFVFALIYGRKIGGLAGALGLTLFDLTAGWTLWAPFTFVIAGAVGWTVGAFAESNRHYRLSVYCASVAIANLITISGYYIVEGILYGNWIAPAGSIPVNFLQVTIAAIIAYPIAKRLKNSVFTRSDTHI